MRVLVLAAGLSKRLKPLEDKNFLEFLGKPLIQHQIEQLQKLGLKDMVVVGGPHNLGKLKVLCAQLSPKIKVVKQEKIIGMAEALMSAQKYILDEPLLMLSANDVVEIDAYKRILEAAKDPKIDALLIGKKVESYFPGGYLKIDKKGFMTGIVEKPGAGNEPSDMVNLVIHFHRDPKRLLKAIEKSVSSRDDHYEVALEKLIQEKAAVKIVPYDGFWQAAKYPWHVLHLMNYFLEQLASKSLPKKNVFIAKNATVRGKVVLEEGVKILENAVVIGPVYIGKNTVVATGALVRGSHIGANSVIGFGSEVARSYVGNEVWTHSNYVGDSIIGNDVSFGAGCVTGNLRLDENNIQALVQGGKIDTGLNKFGLVTGNHVRCGINTSFMPGVKVGSNCFVGAGIVISEDIEDNKYVYGKTELTVKENKVVVGSKKRGVLKITQ